MTKNFKKMIEFYFTLRQFFNSSSKSFDYCSLMTTSRCSARETKSRSSYRLTPKSKFNIIAIALFYTTLLLSEMCVHVEASMIDEAAIKEVRFKKADVDTPILKNDSPNLSSTSDTAGNSKPSVSNKDDIKASNHTENETKNNTSHNEENSEATSIFTQMKDNKDMLMRTMYVTLGVTGIVVVYFIIRAVRLRRKRTKSRKYGIITQQGDHGDMEMEPLGAGDDEEEDYTVFEVNGHKK
ncbi:membrane protein FAM174A-like [Physella acuta]|uniref:membrane protein FAM174A-like n=1 Tax=Physella acuta TaxID=109671 RepID=UPI0027DC883B|nr:membrane protein FAM174A-like [Physella acuta]